MTQSELNQSATIQSPIRAAQFAARRSGAAARALALGFVGAVAMWALAYLAMMNPGPLIGEALFGLTLVCVLAAGWFAGRYRLPNEEGWTAGFKTGIVIATLNMLLIGSLIGGAAEGERMTQALMWVGGNYLVTIVLATIGGALAARRDLEQQTRDWFSLFTRVAAVTVLLLLITGGLVTGLEAGLAVPDWPNSFGHNMLLYPLSKMTGGVFYEHAHRLYGMLVGVTAITLAVSAFIFDERKAVRGLAVAYLLMVCVQGYMGGTRVTEASVPLAIVHGVFGQIVFATACAIAVVTSPGWRGRRTPASTPAARTDRLCTTLLVAGLIVQLALGAMFRHMQPRPGSMHVLYTHIGWAMIMLGLAIFVGGRAWRGNQAAGDDDRRLLMRFGKSTLHTIGLQIALGVVALFAVLARNAAAPTTSGEATPIGTIPLWEIVFTTAHQAVGALLLALATMLMLWTRRVLPVRG